MSIFYASLIILDFKAVSHGNVMYDMVYWKLLSYSLWKLTISNAKKHLQKNYISNEENRITTGWIVPEVVGTKYIYIIYR